VTWALGKGKTWTNDERRGHTPRVGFKRTRLMAGGSFFLVCVEIMSFFNLGRQRNHLLAVTVLVGAAINGLSR